MKRISSNQVPSVLQVSSADLESFLTPLVSSSHIGHVSVGSPTKRGVPVTVHDINAHAWVPNFDITGFVSATLIDPQTARCVVDLSGVAGAIQAVFTKVGGMAWLASCFAEHEAFTVTDDGHVDVHLDRLPADIAEWLTNRCVLDAVAIPGDHGAAATVTFHIQRFMRAEVVRPAPKRSPKPQRKAAKKK